MFICGLSEVSNFQSRATHLISILDPDTDEELPTLGLPKAQRLVLRFHDLDHARDVKVGFDGKKQIPPQETHVRKALAFANRLSSCEQLLIHCHHGISRSTAMAFAVLCQASPQVSEQKLLAQVIQIQPEAVPNILVVKHADNILCRNGDMLKAFKRFYRIIS